MAALAKLVEAISGISLVEILVMTGKNRTLYDCIEFKSPFISSKDIISASLE